MDFFLENLNCCLYFIVRFSCDLNWIHVSSFAPIPHILNLAHFLLNEKGLLFYIISVGHFNVTYYTFHVRRKSLCERCRIKMLNTLSFSES